MLYGLELSYFLRIVGNIFGRYALEFHCCMTISFFPFLCFNVIITPCTQEFAQQNNPNFPYYARVILLNTLILKIFKDRMVLSQDEINSTLEIMIRMNGKFLDFIIKKFTDDSRPRKGLKFF